MKRVRKVRGEEPVTGYLLEPGTGARSRRVCVWCERTVRDWCDSSPATEGLRLVTVTRQTIVEISERGSPSRGRRGKDRMSYTERPGFRPDYRGNPLERHSLSSGLRDQVEKSDLYRV